MINVKNESSGFVDIFRFVKILINYILFVN